MPSLTTPKFDPPTVNKSKQTANVRISGQVYFTAYDRQQMSQGLMFRLECRIQGVDTGGSPTRFVFPFKYYPDGTTNTPESYAFVETVGLSVLNEDYGYDEVRAIVTLVNLSNGARIHAYSNQVTGEFAPMGPT